MNQHPVAPGTVANILTQRIQVTASLKAAIDAGHIDRLAQAVRNYFVGEAPDIDTQLFNQDVEEIAMRIWPVAEQSVRSTVAAKIEASLAASRADPDVTSGEAMWEQSGYWSGLETAAEIAREAKPGPIVGCDHWEIDPTPPSSDLRGPSGSTHTATEGETPMDEFMVVYGLRQVALGEAVRAWQENKTFPNGGQEDERTARIVDTARAFEAFLRGDVPSQPTA